MSLPSDFLQRLTEKTDEQLFDMLAHHADYRPEAVAAARTEIERRNLDPTLLAELRSRSEATRTQELQAAQQPLSWPPRLILFVFSLFFPPILLPAFLLAGAYQSKGYVRKAKECWIWMWYGVAFWFLWFLLWVITMTYLLRDVDVETTGAVVVIAISGGLSVSVVVLIDWLRHRGEGRGHGPQATST
jgi:hypothetical protein